MHQKQDQSPDRIVIKDEADVFLLTSVILFFVVVIIGIVASIAEYGFAIGHVAVFTLFVGAVFLVFMYYKNHSSFVQIDPIGISYHETKGVSKVFRRKWSYLFVDNNQIILAPSRNTIVFGGPMHDSVHVIVVPPTMHPITKKIIARLDSNTLNRLRMLKEKYGLNLIVN